ncbi:MAG: hypothetical protein J6J58_04350 [Oscillospiraceae bacterium]|nr:hypothetical protein [Oscillospiraceae bacterium]
MFPDSIFSLIAILLLAFSLYKLCNLNASVTPFVSVCTVTAFVSLLSLINLLSPAVWLSYILSAVLFAFAAKKSADLKKDIADFFTPGVIMFVIGCVFMYLILMINQPVLFVWDEFSFWGTSQKLTKYHDAIYTYYDSSLIGKTTPPALCALVYFFQPIGDVYVEWKGFFAYDVLLLASFAAWTAAFKKEKWHNAFLVFLFGFLTPFVFEVYTKIVYMVRVYISVMSDIPLGVTFAGAMAVYFFGKNTDENLPCKLDSSKGTNSANHVIALLPVLISFTLMKDMGFAFSLIITFMVFADMFFVQPNFVFVKIKGFLGKIAAAAVMGITTVATFMAWTVHMAKVLQANRFELGGSHNLGMAEMLIVGVKELLSPEKSPKFIDMTNEMLGAFSSKPVSMFGNGIRTIFVITALFAIAFVLVKGWRNMLKIAVLYVTNVISFAAYYLFHLFIYVYIFKANAYGLPSYERYMYPFYLAWLAMGVFCLVFAAKHPRFEKISQLALCGFCICLFGLFSYLVSYENTFIMYSGERESIMDNIFANCEVIEDVVEPDDVIFCYSEAEDSGERWFKYTYVMSPSVIAQDIPWFNSDGMDEATYNATWRQYFLKYVEDAGITHFLLDYGNNKLQDMFGDELGVDVLEYGLYKTAYFEITAVDSANDYIEFSLVKEGEVERQ